MPIKIQGELPVKEILEKENIFVMDETRAVHQDIRPIQILILNLMPLKEETERLEKEEKRLQGELARVNGMLHNEKFMSKAPEAKVAEERAKLEKYTQMMEQVQERLGQLRK